jgi:hypothetical protein
MALGKTISSTLEDFRISDFQVFLNYPFDEDFEAFALAMHFAVVATGLIPICSKDISVPDQPRLEMLVDMVSNCRFSVHDFSRYRGEGEKNFARFNMPIEMGMALFYSFSSKQYKHRCAFFVPTSYDYQRFASDLAGLDPIHYEDDLSLVTSVYEWLHKVGKPYVGVRATTEVQEKYKYFKKELERVKGSGRGDSPTHDEAQELMYEVCSECGWWDWRVSKWGKLKFPHLPLSWKT